MTNKTIILLDQIEGSGQITWEYIGTVDAPDTADGVGVHPRKIFKLWYYGVPRVETPGFGPTTWDVWVPRGKPGYSDKQIAKWQRSCPHRFHDDALEIMRMWEESKKIGHYD